MEYDGETLVTDLPFGEERGATETPSA